MGDAMREGEKGRQIIKVIVITTKRLASSRSEAKK